MRILKIFPIIAMLLVVSMAGCKKDGLTSSSPMATSIDMLKSGNASFNLDAISTNPINGAIGVPVDKVIMVTINKSKSAAKITKAAFTLIGTKTVVGTVVYTDSTATFTPAANLAPNTLYKATIYTSSTDVSDKDSTKEYSDKDHSKDYAHKDGDKEDGDKNYAKGYTWSFTTNNGTVSTPEAVNLRTAGNYVILAKSAITNIATSAITGDLALSPAAASYITGFALIAATGYATSSQVTGKVYAADMAAPTPINLTTAVNDMVTAYNDIAGRTNPNFTELGTGNIGGKTLTPGLYKWSSAVTIPSTITISGGANDVWIFQIAGNLTMSTAVNVILTGGAQAKNIIWQVAGQVTLGTTSHFEGIILSKTAVTLQTGASLNGKIMAQTAVALDKNKVTIQ